MMRAALKPKGTAPMVLLRINESAFYHVDFINKCIDQAEQRCMMQAMGLDTVSDLEKLAMHVLLDSAHITRPT